MKPLSLLVLLVPLCVSGCMATRPARPASDNPMAAPVAMAPLGATRAVELRYDVRSYRDPLNPSVRHEAHAIFRRTRVPLTAPGKLETVPRETFAPASVALLPPSAELNAELATQRKMTAELRAAQAALAEAAERMQSQYALLVRQSTDTAQLREQLEAERIRLQNTPTSLPVTLPSTPTAPTEAKW